MHKGLLKAILSQGGLDPITKAYFDGMANAVPADFKKLYDTYLVRNKKTVNGNVITFKQLLALHDVFYTPVINNTNDSFRNLAKNAHHGTIQGSGLVFDPYWGWNGGGTGWVDTNYNPATQASKLTLNNIGLSVNIINRGATGFSVLGCEVVGGNRLGIMYNISTTMRSWLGNASGNVLDASSIPFIHGMHLARRTASNVTAFLNQNIPNAIGSITSVGLPSRTVGLFTSNGNKYYWTGGINFVGIGASLTDDQFTALNLIVNEFLIQCLYYKYGSTNWGVQMAKSYFDTLHNFEPYEAWEIYEFIKRHQPDYVEPIIPLASSNFDTDGTAWWELASPHTKSWNVSGYMTLTSTSSAISMYVRRNQSLGVDIGRTYRVRFKYKSPNYTGKLWVYLNSTYIGAAQTNNCTSSWQQYDNNITAVTNSFFINQVTTSLGDQVDLDDIIIEDVSFTTGYYYNTFGPSGQNKTVADFIMLFKAGGNLDANAWTKTGATLRWNQDGAITSSNTMPAYTRSTNLGIVTVSSTDGWNGVTMVIINQSAGSVNSFYGNFPKFIGTLKISGSKCALAIRNNRMKVDVRNQPIASLCYHLYIIQSNTGYNKVLLQDLIGGGYSTCYVLGEIYASRGKVSGDVTFFTNEVTDSIYLRNDRAITGSLRNIVLPNTLTTLYFDYTSITLGLGSWNKYIATYYVADCYFSTAEVNSQLAMINSYFAANTPIKNVTINLSGSTMGIPTGGANNTDLLGIVAKHAAAGFTATITVRTS